MLSAIRKSDGKIVIAESSPNVSDSFVCPACFDSVLLKFDENCVKHFTHEHPFGCQHGEGESADHRHCKTEIYRALVSAPGVTDVALERPFGAVRPDISAVINGVPVAIEIQISSISVLRIVTRTKEYSQKGIHVLWLLQWTPELNGRRYAPQLWERWVHACYFGRAYYWIDGLKVAEYRLDPYLRAVPVKTWHSASGKKIQGGGYSVRSKRYREPVKEALYNITQFKPRDRGPWQTNEFVVPEAKLFMPPRGLDNSAGNN